MKPLWIVPLAAALLVGCSEEKAPEPLRPALFVVVQPELTEHFGRFAGTIEARYESTLGFRVPGRIVRRYYDVGAVVKQGDILANLDPTDQQNQLRSAQGDLAKVQAQLINAQANARRQQELFDRGGGAQARTRHRPGRPENHRRVHATGRGGGQSGARPTQLLQPAR
jgi:membrane fusion protein, multidrug efflux system